MISSNYDTENDTENRVLFFQNYLQYRYWIEKNGKKKPIPKIFMKEMNKCKNKAFKKQVINDKQNYDFITTTEAFKDVYKIEKTIFKNIGDLDDEDLTNITLVDDTPVKERIRKPTFYNYWLGERLRSFSEEQKKLPEEDRVGKIGRIKVIADEWMKFKNTDAFVEAKSKWEELSSEAFSDESNHIKVDFDIRTFFSTKKSNYKCFTFSESQRRLGWLEDNGINEIFKAVKRMKNDGEDIKISKKTFDLGGVNWFSLEVIPNEEDCHPCFFTMAHSEYISKGRIFYFRTENNRDLMFDYLS